MARSVRDLVVRFLGDEKDLARSTKKVDSDMGRLKRGFDVFQGLLGGAVVGAVVGVTKALGEMAQAAAEDAKSQDTLHAAVRQNTDATEAQIGTLDKWIDRMQLATNVADTDLRQAIQSLVTAGADLDEAQRIVATSTDIAARRGKDFNTVIEAMVKAQNGQVSGLSRLGIATKNAAGQTLTFDEVLKNAAETMGGAAAEGAATLADGMERAKIIMEEASEEAGKSALGPFSKLGDIWAVLNELFKTGQAEISTLNEEFNDLVRSGVNPLVDKGQSAIDILLGMLEHTAVSRDTFATLRAMLAFTAEDTATLRNRLRETGEELGFTREQVEALITAMSRDEIEEYHNNLDAGRHRRQQFIEDTQDAAEAVSDLQDTVKALFNPVRQIRQAEEDWEDAARRQAQALASGRTDTEAATEAGLDLAEAYVDMNVAAGQLDKTGVVGFLRGIAAEAGIAQTSIASLQGALDGLALTSPINIPINVTTTTRGSTSGSAQTRTIAGSVRNLVEN
jgi:chromosome segregation ATPase